MAYLYIKMRIIALCLLIFACGPSTPGINGFEVLQGSWVCAQPSGTFTETWTFEKERMCGRGYLVQGKDTLFGEKLLVQRVNDRLVYIADVPGQDPVLFTCKQQGKSFRFENREHDFPQVIVYELQQHTRLRITLEGEEKGIFKKETLLFNRQ